VQLGTVPLYGGPDLPLHLIFAAISELAEHILKL